MKAPWRTALIGAIGGGLLVTLAVLLILASRPASMVAPSPAVTEDISLLPELPPSTLNVPITYDLRSVLEALEREVPAVWGSVEERLRHPTNSRVSFAFEVERSEFDARLDGDTARLSARLRYRGRGWYDPPLAPEVSASCGTNTQTDDRPSAIVAISSPLTLAEDWTLVGRARVERVAAASAAERDQCRVTIFDIDVTERVLNAARDQLEGNTDVIDEALARIDLYGRFERYWEIIREPIRLTDDVWLLINPTAVRRGPARGTGLTLEASVGLTAAPRIYLGPRPVVDSLPLPPIQEADVDDGLHILLDGLADYDAASRLLRRELRGQSFTWGSNRIELRDLHVSGIGGGRMALEVDFTGTARGRIYLVGTPVIDPGTREVWVPDLDFDVATRSLLVSGAVWLAYGNLVEALRERARIPVDDVVELAREQLLRGLNRELSSEVQLSGEVDEVEVLAVEASRDRLVVRSHARARARLEIQQRGEDDAADEQGEASPPRQ
jgi:hypothetical protein